MAQISTHDTTEITTQLRSLQHCIVNLRHPDYIAFIYHQPDDFISMQQEQYIILDSAWKFWPFLNRLTSHPGDQLYNYIK
jgi:hypothetical protein